MALAANLKTKLLVMKIKGLNFILNKDGLILMRILLYLQVGFFMEKEQFV